MLGNFEKNVGPDLNPNCNLHVSQMAERIYFQIKKTGTQQSADDKQHENYPTYKELILL